MAISILSALNTTSIHTPAAPSTLAHPPCREDNTQDYPRGLNQFLRALRFWLYDRPPFEPLLWEEPLGGIKAALAEGEDMFSE